MEDPLYHPLILNFTFLKKQEGVSTAHEITRYVLHDKV